MITKLKYGDPERLFSGEVGRYYGVRFIEENNYLVNTIGTNRGEAVIFGADAVMEGVTVPEEVRAKVPTDYGRSRGIAWYALLGWTKIHYHHRAGDVAHIIHFTDINTNNA